MDNLILTGWCCFQENGAYRDVRAVKSQKKKKENEEGVRAHLPREIFDF
jgi:hypothetical protein